MDSQASSRAATVPGMADKGWTVRMAAAAGAAAGTGAAQLGLGYGLGVVVWPVADTVDDSVWLGSLGWATWITASATVFGAVFASRFGGGPATRMSRPWRLALATSAAVGALVAVALIALPARSAVRADTFSPQVIAGGYAVIGLLLGLVVAYWAIVCRPVAANVIATAVWLWALAITAIVVDLTTHRSSATYLTSWQFAEPGTGHRYGAISWPSAVLTLAAAFLIGMIAVVPAVRRRDLGVGAASSGAVGPLLVASAFFFLTPRLTGTPGPLESAYLIAPYAVLAGLAGSALTVRAGQTVAERERRGETSAGQPGALPATGVAAVPATDDGAPESSRGTNTASADTDDDSPTEPVIRRSPPHESGDTSAPAAENSDPAAWRTSGDDQKAPGRSDPAAWPSSPDGQDAPDASASAAEPVPGRGQEVPDTIAPAAWPASGMGGGDGDGRRAHGKPAAVRPRRAAGASPTSSRDAEPAPSRDAEPAPTRGSAGPAPTGGPSDRAASRQAPAQAASTRATSSRPAAGRPTSSRAAGAAEPRTGADGDEPADPRDPEIAAAARPVKSRGRKASPAPDPPPATSSVTPPPASPTVARINPPPTA
jgi:hypothetical protein